VLLCCLHPISFQFSNSKIVFWNWYNYWKQLFLGDRNIKCAVMPLHEIYVTNKCN
jgi:hypothetical protein